MKYDVSLIERETTINFNELEKTAEIYTCNYMLKKKLDMLCEKFPNDFKLDRDDPDWEAKHYIINKRYIKINAPIIYSEESKEKRTKILETARMIKNTSCT